MQADSGPSGQHAPARPRRQRRNPSAGAAIEALAELQPRTAHLIARAASGQRGDVSATVDIPAEALRPGDTVQRRPAARPLWLWKGLVTGERV